MTRERLLVSAYACVARSGLARTTMDDVAGEAGLSRATLYRYFPGGKEQLVREVVAWEAGRFFERLARAVAHHTDLADMLVETLVFAHRAVGEHEVLQHVLRTEPGRLLPVLTVENARIIALVRQFVVLAMHRSGLQAAGPDDAADYIARMLVSHIGGQGGWDLTDRDQARRLVEAQFLAGLS